jgi:hypothetical protein
VDIRKTRYGTTHFPKSYIRLPFAMICGHGEPEGTSELWEINKQGISEDFVRRCFAETDPFCSLPGMNETLTNYGLRSLRKVHLPADGMFTAPLHLESLTFRRNKPTQNVARTAPERQPLTACLPYNAVSRVWG